MSVPMLLTFNSGSSTVKLGLFEVGKTGARRLAKGVVDFRDEPLAFSLNAGSRTAKVELGGTDPGNVAGVLTQVLATLGKDYDLDRLVAAGHRVVHGGDVFGGPVVVDDEALSSMEALAVLAPLHQPQSLEFVRAMRRLRPGLTQVASFDTAFHARGDAIARRFAIPRALHDAGIKRYGFHGLSYQSIANTLRRDFPASADGRVIVAHLGSGASLCGMEAGVSRDTSMGFSTLDGIPMATRCGAIDPGVLLQPRHCGGRMTSAAAPKHCWRRRRRCEPRARASSSKSYSTRMPCRPPPPAAISPVGPQRGCSNGWKVLARYVNSPAAPRSGFSVVMMTRASAAKSRRRAQSSLADERLHDRELEGLPPDLRWREWMLRVEAVIFAASEPVSREMLARVVGQFLQHRAFDRRPS